MLSKETLIKIESLASQVAEREGCRVYDLDFMGGPGGRTLRIFIDKSGGASVDDCANVSRGLNLLLDVEDPIPGGAYNLEVSTPGLERNLKKPWHFTESKGKKIWLKLTENLGSLGLQNERFIMAKQITEVLSEVAETGIMMQIESENILIPYAAIEKARVVFEFGNNMLDKNKNKKK